MEVDESSFSCFRSTETYESIYIRLSEKFLSFYKEIIDAQCFLFYINLLNYA